MIWALDPIFSEEKENDETVDRLLSILKGHGNYYCQLVFHLSRLLASASDDETVRIWRKTEKKIEEEKTNVPEGEEEEEEDVIQYECVRIFKGHHSGISWDQNRI